MKKFSKKLMALLLVIALLASVLPMSVFAEGAVNVFKNGKYTSEKLSNPTTFEGDVDGLEEGGDRMNSYAWCMEQLGDYIYIGSNRNFMYYGAAQYGFVDKFESPEIFDGLLDVVTNGEIPSYYIDSNGEKQPEDSPHYWTDTARACIVRYNTKTKKMETWFDSADYGKVTTGNLDPTYGWIAGFRGAKTFNGAVYMNAIKLSMTTTGVQAKSVLFRITNDMEKPEVVEGIGGGANLRAMNLSEVGKTLFLGGTEKVNDGDEVDFKPVVYKTTDGVNFEKVVDYTNLVFSRYIAKGAGYWSGDNGDVWDLVEYNQDLYVTFWTEKGSPCFKGTYDASSGTYNWTEFAGDDENSPYPIGFGSEYTQAMTPYVFNGELYFITFSDAVKALSQSYKGLFDYMSASEEERSINTFFDGLKYMEKVMENQTCIFRLTKDGEMQMVVGNENRCPDGIAFKAEIGSGFYPQGTEMGTTTYNWRGAVYNGKLYVGTMDASTIFNYVTKLTNGDLLNMSADEFRQQLYYVKDLLALIVDTQEEAVLQVEEKAELTTEEAKDLVAESYKADELQVEGAQLENNDALAELQTESVEDVEALENKIIDEIIDELVKIQQSLDKEATTEAIYNALENIPEMTEQLTKVQKRLGYLCYKYRHYPTIYQTLKTAYDAVKNVVDQLNAIDQDGLNRYIRISKALTANQDRGFDLYSTKDGIHYDNVTVNGFNDKYNYGVRTLLPTTSGLYLGTANPFYGAQLWKITDGDEAEPQNPQPQNVDTGVQTNDSTFIIVVGLSLTALLVATLYVWNKKKNS